MTTQLTIRNLEGVPFHVYIVEPGELLRYGKEATLRTVEFFDARHHDPANRLGREGQFVADYCAATLLEDRERLAGGLDLCGYEPTWKVDGEALAEVFAALDGEKGEAAPRSNLLDHPHYAERWER